MIIAQISDSHIAADHPKGPERARHLAACVAAINRLDPLPDVVVHTGDVTHQAKPEEFGQARALLKALRPPLHLVAGNRDGREALRDALAGDGRLAPDWPFVQYADDSHPVRLIVADSLSHTGKKGGFCQRRLDHLDSLLSQAPDRPTAIFLHHPPFPVTAAPDPYMYESWDCVTRLTDLLAEHSQEIRLFSGHAHRAAKGQVGEVPASSMAAVAVDLRKGDYPQEHQGRPLLQIHAYRPGAGFTTTTLAAEAAPS